MALFNINIYSNDEELIKLLKANNLKLDNIMASNQDLVTKIEDLQSTVDTEQAQIAALLEINAGVVSDLSAAKAALEASVVELQAQVAAGSTPEQIQAVIDQIEGVNADISSTIADAVVETPPVVDAPVEPGQETA